MLERINDHTFISSNGDSSIALWDRSLEAEEYSLRNVYKYDTIFGSVDSARFMTIENMRIVVTGHSEGFLLIWELIDTKLSLLGFINLRSNQPVESPFKLWNIRSIMLWNEGIIVTASEDGDLCIVDVLERRVLHRQRYNKNAKRGINHIFVIDNYLFLTNCSVGTSDQNFWLYRIEKNQFIYLDSKNLALNKNLEQIFSFDVGCIFNGAKHYFFCSTQEGVVWFGQLENESLNISNYKIVSQKGGAALAIHPSKNCLASVNYDIFLLEILAD